MLFKVVFMEFSDEGERKLNLLGESGKLMKFATIDEAHRFVKSLDATYRIEEDQEGMSDTRYWWVVRI